MVEIGVLKFINYCNRSVLLLEGVEGVYKPLATIDFEGAYLVRSINGSTTECHYVVLVCDSDAFTRFESTLINPGAVVDWTTLDSYILHVRPCIIPSNNAETTVEIMSSGLWYPERRYYTGLSEHFTWCNRLRVSGFNIRECFQHLIAVLWRPRTKFLTDQIQIGSCVVEALHRQEIRSLLQIKRNGEQTDGSAALELWESKEKVFRLEIENVQAELKGYSNIIFQLAIGYYTLSQGVIFTVVSQADSPFTCKKNYISYCVSAIISLATIFGVIKNVKAMEVLKKLIYEHKARLLAVCRWQSTLKREGDRFNYGRATLNYKPMPERVWWPLPWLPLRAAIYTIFTIVTSFALCLLMRQLRCS